MTTARSTQIDLNSTYYYHCITRCVRQSYLCGEDFETGRDYSHRKPWIVARMKKLTSIFAIQICAYAVMSNHYHTILFVNEPAARDWSSEEVKARWAQLFPGTVKEFEAIAPSLSEKKLRKQIRIWRERLMNISWFMRCLNESIARFANGEDERKGRFWDGRFKLQALLDAGAVLSAMVYVDLNPIRAKVADTPEESEFTSIYDRIQQLAKNQKELSPKKIDNAKQPAHLMPFANRHQVIDSIHAPMIDFSLSDYLALVDTTGRMIREDKRGAIPKSLLPILARINLKPDSWLLMVKSINCFANAIGQSENLLAFGSQYRQYSPKGVSAARKFYFQAA